MKYKILGLLAVGLLCVSTANASLLRLDATSLDPDDIYSDFFVIFEDTGDALFQLEETVSFSGVTAFGVLWEELIAVPTIDNISTEGGSCSVDPWCFFRVESEPVPELSVGKFGFTYAITAVPEPGTLALLGLGLLGLGVTRRTAS